MAAQTQLFPKREAVQQLKDRLQAWCEEENRREQEEGVSAPGETSQGAARTVASTSILFCFVVIFVATSCCFCLHIENQF